MPSENPWDCACTIVHCVIDVCFAFDSFQLLSSHPDDSWLWVIWGDLHLSSTRPIAVGQATRHVEWQLPEFFLQVCALIFVCLSSKCKEMRNHMSDVFYWWHACNQMSRTTKLRSQTQYFETQTLTHWGYSFATYWLRTKMTIVHALISTTSFEALPKSYL